MGEVWEIVERAIAVADTVEQRDPIRTNDALKTLRRIADELRAGAPDHPALRRLEDYLREYDH
jgi:hypothetical protein